MLQSCALLALPCHTSTTRATVDIKQLSTEETQESNDRTERESDQERKHFWLRCKKTKPPLPVGGPKVLRIAKVLCPTLNVAQLKSRGPMCFKKISPTPLHHHHQPKTGDERQDDFMLSCCLCQILTRSSKQIKTSQTRQWTVFSPYSPQLSLWES